MFWKKDTPQKSSESPVLGPWEGLVHGVFRFYQASYQEIVRLDKWDWLPLFEKTSQQQKPQDLQQHLDKLHSSFAEARRKEVKEGRRQTNDLRGLVWSGLDQVCQVLESSEKQRAPLAEARQSLQKALQLNDLEGAKRVMREVFTSLLQIDQQRQQSLDRLQKSFQQQLELLQRELHSAQKELQLDGLTQINNRPTFDQQLQKTQQFAYLTAQRACLIMFDIDHFKKINDSWGHPAGDLVIQSLAKTLAQSFSRKTDFVARYGGEEFAAILQGTDEREARELLAKLLVKVKSLAVPHGKQTIHYTISAGLAVYQAGESPQQWLGRADRALYEAKKLGRDRYTIAPLAKAS